MSRATLGEGRFGLSWALALSVALHLVLAVLGWLFPIQTAVPTSPTEEQTLKFTFAPVTERAIADSLPRGDVPFETPAPPPPQATTRLTRESPPLPPVEFTPPPPQGEEAAQPAPEPGEAQRDAEAPPTSPGTSLPEGGELKRSDPAGPRPRSGFSTERALQDFRRALRRPGPPSESPREGEGSRDGVQVPDLPPTPATGFGFGNLRFESRDYDWNDYARQIYMVIWRAWHNRLYRSTSEFERWAYAQSSWYLDHRSLVRFTIERNGQVTGIVVEGPSGCHPLDDSAADALREVILPPLPDDFPRDREVVHAAFVADGPVRTMKQFLGALKRAGWF